MSITFDGEEPWLPTLWDIEARKPDPYWSRFGWEALEVPSGCPLVQRRMDALKVRFDQRYANRQVNMETMEQWQIRLQNRFDEVAPRYERAYKVYADKEQTMLDDVEEGSHTTSTVRNKGRSIDTPDSVINADPNYADSLDEAESTGDTKTVITGTGLVRSINATIDEWRELDTEFVKEFEDNFINIFWY